jgi:hypothetical protein
MYNPYRPKAAGDKHYKGRKATTAQDIEELSEQNTSSS